MPYQPLPNDERRRKVVPAPQAIAAPPAVRPAKTPLRQFGDAAMSTVKGISGAIGSMTVGPAIDLTRGAVSLATGNDPRTAPGGAFATTAAYNQQAKDAEKAVFGGTGQAIQEFGGKLTGTQPAAPAPAAPVVQKPAPAPTTAVVPQGTLASLQQPAAEQAIAAPPGKPMDARAENQAFLSQRARDRGAQLARRDAQIDASIANANQQSLRNMLQSELNRTRPGGGIQRQGEFRPRGGADPRTQLIAQLAGLNTPIAPKATPTVADQQKVDAELAAAATKKQADNVSLEAGQLALKGAQRKAALQDQLIAQIDPTSPEATRLRANLAALDGKSPNEGRFESIEEVVGTDQFGTPIKVRSLYDTQTGGFIDRGKTGATAQAQQQYEEGKVYSDANGNKAKFVNGKFQPL